MRLMPFLMMFFALVPIGCDELDSKKTDTKSSAPGEKKAASPPSRPAGPPVPDDSDPVVRSAEFSSQRVAELEERIDASLTAVGDDLKVLSAADFRAIDRTAEKLLATVQLLRQSGERILEAYPKVKSDLIAIVKANANVKVGYGRAKELYLEKAGLENGELQDRYLTLAELCDTFVRTNDERTTYYATFAKDLDKAVAKVDRHVQFLKDFEAFLKLNPATNGAKDRDQFIASINAFAEQVLKFGEVLQLFRDKVRAGAVSQKLRTAHEKTVAERVEREKAVAAKSPSKSTPIEQVKETSASVPTVTTEVTKAAEIKTPSNETSQSRSLAVTNSPVMTCVTNSPTRYVPVSVNRWVSTLVPVTYYQSQPDICGCCHLSTFTHYEWRHQLVTETCYYSVRE